VVGVVVVSPLRLHAVSCLTDGGGLTPVASHRPYQIPDQQLLAAIIDRVSHELHTNGRWLPTTTTTTTTDDDDR
jgi:hypothetical protein